MLLVSNFTKSESFHHKAFFKDLTIGVGYLHHITTFHRTTAFVKHLSRAASENLENVSEKYAEK